MLCSICGEVSGIEHGCPGVQEYHCVHCNVTTSHKGGIDEVTGLCGSCKQFQADAFRRGQSDMVAKLEKAVLDALQARYRNVVPGDEFEQSNREWNRNLTQIIQTLQAVLRDANKS